MKCLNWFSAFMGQKKIGFECVQQSFYGNGEFSFHLTLMR